MIGMLRGHVESVDAVSAIIEVGGVGYEVRMQLQKVRCH